MGGSNFDFAHSRLEWDVIEKIERIIKRNNTEIPIKERPSWQDPEYYEKYPEEKLKCHNCGHEEDAFEDELPDLSDGMNGLVEDEEGNLVYPEDLDD